MQTLTLSCHFTYVPKPNSPSQNHLGASWCSYRALQPAAQCFSLSSDRVQHPVSGSPFVQLSGNESFWKPKEGKKSTRVEKSHLLKDELIIYFWTTQITPLDNFSNIHFTHSLCITGINTQGLVDQLLEISSGKSQSLYIFNFSGSEIYGERNSDKTKKNQKTSSYWH